MYNEEKTLKWLKKKTERVAATLAESYLNVDGSAVSSNYIMSSKQKTPGTNEKF